MPFFETVATTKREQDLVFQIREQVHTPLPTRFKPLKTNSCTAAAHDTIRAGSKSRVMSVGRMSLHGETMCHSRSAQEARGRRNEWRNGDVAGTVFGNASARKKCRSRNSVVVSAGRQNDQRRGNKWSAD